MNALLFSNSTMPGQPYLHWTLPFLRPFLENAEEVLFVPYAGVGIEWDEYTLRLSNALPGAQVTGLHTLKDKTAAIASAQAIVVGGGNTFSLLRRCQDEGLLTAIRGAVGRGARYAGWSAGANLACPTIKTTNDMPIESTDGLDALGLISFQLNPHYTDKTVEGHGGESRSQRLHEFTLRNPEAPVIGLPEGMFLEVLSGGISLRGEGTAQLFHGKREPRQLHPGTLHL